MILPGCYPKFANKMHTRTGIPRIIILSTKRSHEIRKRKTSKTIIFQAIHRISFPTQVMKCHCTIIDRDASNSFLVLSVPTSSKQEEFDDEILEM